MAGMEKNVVYKVHRMLFLSQLACKTKATVDFCTACMYLVIELGFRLHRRVIKMRFFVSIYSYRIIIF